MVKPRVVLLIFVSGKVSERVLHIKRFLCAHFLGRDHRRKIQKGYRRGV